MQIEIKLSIQSAYAGGSHFMGIIRIHLIIHFLECGPFVHQSMCVCLFEFPEVRHTDIFINVNYKDFGR